MNLESSNRGGKHGGAGKKVLVVVIALVIAALLALSAFLWFRLHDSEAEARQIKDKASKVMVLPDEDALVSKVDKAEEIRNQPFFQNVENGDQVLIFVKAGKIVIFRPSENKIINAGPIINDGVGSSTGDSTPNETPTVDPGDDALEEE